MGYFVQWGHAYVMHFGAWVSFICGTSIYKSGLPELKDVSKMLKTAFLLSLVLSIFSSHSHTHYIKHFGNQVSNAKK